MKIALTVWDGRISPVFDVSRQLVVYEVEAKQLVGVQRARFDDDRAACKIEQLIRLGVNVLVCGAISEPLQTALVHQGIDVICFIAGEESEVIGAYLRGGLPSDALLMPGCRSTKGRRGPRWRWRRRAAGRPNMN